MEISLNTGAPNEISAKMALENFLTDKKLTTFLFSKKVCLGSGAVSRAFPVITLNADDVQDKNTLLANFLHHQFRWYVSLQGERTDEAIDGLKAIFPVVPVSEDGSAHAVYLQLLVGALEYFALAKLTDKVTAKKVVQGKSQAGWVYSQILDKEKEVRTLLKACKLNLAGM